ncbi:MAG TPA: enoyl-CoA hydratase [Stellaceae bacterium]|nr:enoyl-CoA hydratase [Stellaceae bacterium]
MNMISLPTERMIAEVDGAIGWLTFNNPSRRNAVSMDMWQAIPEIMDAFERDPAVRVIVLQGAGDKSFVSGADISEFEKNRSTAEGVARYEEIGNRAQSRLVNAQKPTIAMIRGFCMGGGVGVALSCDLRIAAESAQFGIPAAKLGIGYRLDGLTKLMALVGPAFAKEIFYTARRFTAAEAHGMGLVNRVLPDGELEGFVRSYCAMIAENAPLSLKAAKGIVTELTKLPDEVDRARCEALVKECFESEDYVEGRRAFMEKRKPQFKGR